jgi:hypothetical protein
MENNKSLLFLLFFIIISFISGYLVSLELSKEKSKISNCLKKQGFNLIDYFYDCPLNNCYHVYALNKNNNKVVEFNIVFYNDSCYLWNRGDKQ